MIKRLVHAFNPNRGRPVQCEFQNSQGYTETLCVWLECEERAVISTIQVISGKCLPTQG